MLNPLFFILKRSLRNYEERRQPSVMVTIPQLSKVWPLTPKTYRHRTSHGLKVQPVVRIFGDDAKGKKRPSKMVLKKKVWLNFTVQEEYMEDIIWGWTSEHVWTDKTSAVWRETITWSSIWEC